jgi:alpha-D-xyloside xylohydrolase
MFGPAILVNPVTDYKVRSRSVYLPEGGWYALGDGEFVKGGRRIVADAPYENIPLFVRAGSIVPTGPEIMYTGERPPDPIRLFVYTGASGSFTLYEDDGVTNRYERGEWSKIPFVYNDTTGTLTIGKREGGYPGMLVKRTFEVVWVAAGSPRSLEDRRQSDASITYDGSERIVSRQR